MAEFVAERVTSRRNGNVMPDVWVAHSSRAEPSEVCLRAFKKVFGFTPRKGKRYTIQIGDVDVVEEDLE